MLDEDLVITKSFIKVFEEKHIQPETIAYIIDKEARWECEKKVLAQIEKIAINDMHKAYPELRYIKSFSHRDNRPKIQIYAQAFHYVAYINGFKKIAIARHIKRNHASIINGIKQAKNALFCDSQKFIKIYLSLLKSTYYYVGSISTNIKRQDNPKSTLVVVRHERKNSSTSD